MAKNDILLNEIKDYDFSRIENRFSKAITDFPLSGFFSSAKDNLIEIVSDLIVTPGNIHTVTDDTFVIFREFTIMQKTYMSFCSKFFPKFYLNLTIDSSGDQLVGILKLVPNNNHQLSYFGLLKNRFKFGVSNGSSRISNIYASMYSNRFSSDGEYKEVKNQYEAIAKVNNWNVSSIVVFNEFIKFFSLLQNTDSRLGMLSKQIDAMWHSFISDDQVYTKLCLTNGGKYIYHEDGTDESFEDDFSDYITLLKGLVDNSNIFGEIFDEEVWPFPKSLVDKYGYSFLIEESNDKLVTKFKLSSKNEVFKLVKLILNGTDYYEQTTFSKYRNSDYTDDLIYDTNWRSIKPISRYNSSSRSSSDSYQYDDSLDSVVPLILLDDAIISTPSNNTKHTSSCSSCSTSSCSSSSSTSSCSSSSTSSCSSSTSSCSSSSCSSSSCGSSCGGC